MRRSITIRISLDGAHVGEHTFEEPTIKIGNATTAHLRLEHPSVSRVHCVIEAGSEISVMDLGSESGTFVNAAPITRANLMSGDQLRVGVYVLDVTAGEPMNLLGEPAAPKPALEPVPLAEPALRRPSILDLAADRVSLPAPPPATVELAPRRAETVELADSDLVEIGHDDSGVRRRD